MKKAALEMELNAALHQLQKELEPLQSRGYNEELQCVINELSQSTYHALDNFKKAILDNIE